MNSWLVGGANIKETNSVGNITLVQIMNTGCRVDLERTVNIFRQIAIYFMGNL